MIGSGSENLGPLLWEWRTRRSLSLGQLAQAAGLHKSALSRWESGKRLPRVPELEAVLRALDVSAAEAALAFACIPAPRALQHLQHELAPLTSSPLTRGDLLHALRVRQGWTQAQVAHHLGVSAQLVARWERSERLPSQEQIQALCYALGARLDEVVALTTGLFGAEGAGPPALLMTLPPRWKRSSTVWDKAERPTWATIYWMTSCGAARCATPPPGPCCSGCGSFMPMNIAAAFAGIWWRRCLARRRRRFRRRRWSWNFGFGR